MARMPDQPTHVTRSRDVEWRVSAAALIAAVLFRSAIFVFWERAHFDSDQAVMGLMAKHLAEGRALPVFFTGSTTFSASRPGWPRPFSLRPSPLSRR
jgi:hypothetical protein